MPEAWYETAFGAHYPLLYAHRDDAEARRVLGRLRRMADLAPPLLDLGCGDGRHLAGLPAGLAPAVGLDLSAALLNRARRVRDPGLRLVRGDMRRLPLRAGSCGAVLSLFTAFGYFADAEANARPVAEIARVLRGGGHWCLDYFDGERVRAALADGRPRTRRRAAGPLDVTETRRYDAARRVVRKEVRLRPRRGREEEAMARGCGAGGLEYAEEVMVFTLDEIDAMAAAAGMVRVAAAGDYDGGPLGAGDRWLLVYRRGASA